MRIYDVIDKKKKGTELSREEIEYVINGYVNGEIPDYQISALLMAIYFQGMTDQELLNMTMCMRDSGEKIDLSAINGIKVDKHSTGGVGDKTTLVVAPLVAACGGKVAKMSGRGLGFTGGTIDKLEAIPGMQTAITDAEFFKIVNEIGISVIGQSTQVAPADKKLYALRDVTATVDSIPLIAASIMSKKLAAGSDKIVLDVTVGSGAFMKELDSAILLAEKMVAIGEGAGKETVAFLTNMDVPLGEAVGNSIEVVEAIETLGGGGPEDFKEVCIQFAANMLYLGEVAPLEQCLELVQRKLSNGGAMDTLAEMVHRQGGDAEYIYHPEKFIKAKYQSEYLAPKDGYIVHMDTEECGKTAVVLGAGRETKDSEIDFTAGIRFYKKTGDKVKVGDSVATLYASSSQKLKEGMEYIERAYQIGEDVVTPWKTVLAKVTKSGTERY